MMLFPEWVDEMLPLTSHAQKMQFILSERERGHRYAQDFNRAEEGEDDEEEVEDDEED